MFQKDGWRQHWVVHGGNHVREVMDGGVQVGATSRSMWKQDKVTRPSREIVCVAHQSWIQRKAEGGGGYNHWFCLHVWVVQTLRITFIIATFSYE
jgi:hypothetical protein